MQKPHDRHMVLPRCSPTRYGAKRAKETGSQNGSCGSSPAHDPLLLAAALHGIPGRAGGPQGKKPEKSTSRTRRERSKIRSPGGGPDTRISREPAMLRLWLGGQQGMATSTQAVVACFGIPDATPRSAVAGHGAPPGCSARSPAAATG
jgi:hypothetical protein